MTGANKMLSEKTFVVLLGLLAKPCFAEVCRNVFIFSSAQLLYLTVNKKYWTSARNIFYVKIISSSVLVIKCLLNTEFEEKKIMYAPQETTFEGSDDWQ